MAVRLAELTAAQFIHRRRRLPAPLVVGGTIVAALIVTAALAQWIAPYPYDQMLQIYGMWQAGAYITYHHDMFQTGYGTPSIPPSGIPDPEFNPYHKAVLEFISHRERYQSRGCATH